MLTLNSVVNGGSPKIDFVQVPLRNSAIEPL